MTCWRDRIRRAVAGVCIVAGAALLAGAASVTFGGWMWQERHADLFLPPSSSVPRPAGGDSPRPIVHPLFRGEAIARLRVPRLGIESLIVEGTDPKSLRLGPGHMEGSALPGEPDNCIIAGHRDGAFRRLRSVRSGDVVEITHRAGVSRYRVDSIRMVDKENADPLAPSREPVLTLVTCYPFEYVGHAPKRFVVRASLLPDGPAPASDRERITNALE